MQEQLPEIIHAVAKQRRQGDVHRQGLHDTISKSYPTACCSQIDSREVPILMNVGTGGELHGSAPLSMIQMLKHTSLTSFGNASEDMKAKYSNELL